LHRFLRFKHSLWAIFFVALAARLAVATILYRDHINPILDHWKFGWEMGEVARSIYLGQGFSSPLFEPTGPTAWMAPVYPWIIAICFKLFGLHTVASSWAICTFNAICGALTAVVVYHIARYTFGDRVSWLAGWVWAVLPYSVYIASARIWENSLTTLIFAAIFLQTLRINDRSTPVRWIAWGALWGAAALTSPALLSTLPFLGLWLAYRSAKTGRPWFLRATTSALVFFALLAPWTIRNYLVMHRFIPLRDNFWLEMHVGNNGRTFEPTPDGVHPTNSAEEREQWNRLGELGYMDAKKVETKAFMKSHPGFVAWMTVRRFIFTWTGFWSLTPDYIEEEPFTIPTILITSLMTFLMLVAFRWGKRNGYGERLTPYALVLISFPLVYYISHPQMDYRHPIDPLLVVLSSYSVLIWLEKRREAKLGKARTEPELAAESRVA
jgi:4-amino-4-deoxy-L-arabinose transferase-like glycosyltransferase